MNSSRILVSGACKLRLSASGHIRITNGPVYDLTLAKKTLGEHGLRVINDSAEADQTLAFEPEMTDQELTSFILALESEDFQGSERCKTSIGRTLDTDSYAMKWNRNRCCRWDAGRKIYVKFGFAESNPRCLVVRIHPAKW